MYRSSRHPGKDKHFNPFSHKNALTLSFWSSVLLSSNMLLGYLFNKGQIQPDHGGIINIFLSNALVCYLLFIWNFHFIQKKYKRFKEYTLITVGTLLLAVVLSVVISRFMFFIDDKNTLLMNRYITMSLIRNLIVFFIVQLCTMLLHSIQQRQVADLENERLITENIRIRYAVLKNQVDPHFLFNSLNTLDGLVGIDDNRAHEFLQNISLVLRYTMNNKEILYLSEELAYTESYANLMRIRYGDNFTIHYAIDEKYKNWYIMPISLQLLVENAIKHNVISTRSPLIINIETTPQATIKVQNPIHLKKEGEPGEGIGLANLTERYKLLFQKEIVISKTDVFSVEIPLIEQLNHKKKMDLL